MADFPILKWMQVDGRSVPFTYPQHQKGNGYVVTGEDNPLPTANHVMTESGIWVPQRGTEEGAAHTQLTGSIKEEELFRDVVIPSEAYYIVRFLVSGYNRFTVGISSESSGIELYIRLRNSSGSHWLTQREMYLDGNERFDVTDVIDVRAPEVNLIFFNTNETEVEVRSAYLYKIN